MSPWDVRVDGLDDAERRTLRLAVMLSDLRWFWPRLVPLFIGWMGRQFATEGRFFGDPWEPLSPAYAAWKASRYPGKSILQAEGKLLRAATTPRRRVGPRTLVLEINDYERSGRTMSPSWFQGGTVSMPARPLLFELPPGEVIRELEAVGEDAARELVNRLGL